MRHLLDTSVLPAHHRQEPGWEQVQAIFEDPNAEAVIASISLTEFARRLSELGANDAEARQTIADYRQLLSEVVPIDAEVAMAAFDLARLTATRLPLVDALIAATARVRGARLVHRDSHLRSIPRDLVEQTDLQPAQV